MKKQFSQLLLAWYAKNAREMPWRGIGDAYAVWVSEIMLQQTRVETVIPYFMRWMERFPTLCKLAQASEQEVLTAWEGLGYYSRARSLLKAARLVQEQMGGLIPANPKELLKLPGIGKYTAAAISSIAFGADEAVLDGNVKRVLARCFQYEGLINTPEGEKELWQLAESLLPEGKAGNYNQAVMDLGAMICTPNHPACEKCPLVDICLSCKTNLQDEYPRLKEKAPVPHISVVAAIISKESKVLIARRPSKGLLGGLWEFPGGKIESGESQEEALAREIREELGVEIKVNGIFGKYKHAYTHFKVTLFAYKCALNGQEPVALEASEIRWVHITQLGDFPMGKIDRAISKDLSG